MWFKLWPVKRMKVIIHILTRKSWKKPWKQMSFLELIRKLRLQGKFPLKNLQWWDNPESNSQDLFTWNRTCWCHKMLRTLNFHTLLETEYGLIWEWEPPRDSRSGEYIQGLYIQVPQQIFKLNFSRNGKKWIIIVI